MVQGLAATMPVSSFSDQKRKFTKGKQTNQAYQFITISRAFSMAAAVGFSPLSILAMAVIRSSVVSCLIFVFTLSFTISL